MSGLGAVIKQARTDQSLSLNALSVICNVSNSAIERIETGKSKNPQWDTLCKICDALNIPRLELLLLTGYISKNDINPVYQLHRLNKLNSADINNVQLYIDFLVYKGDTLMGNEDGK